MKNIIDNLVKQHQNKVVQYKFYCLQEQIQSIDKSFWITLFGEDKTNPNNDVYILRERDNYIDELTIYINNVRRMIIRLKNNKYTFLIRLCEISITEENQAMECVELLSELNEKTLGQGNYTIVFDETSCIDSAAAGVISYYFCLPLKNLNLKSLFKALNYFSDVEMPVGFQVVREHRDEQLNRESLAQEFSVEEPDV